jgi:hypothetical protein
MKVFVSYASEQHDLAKRVALALRSVAREVFFDRHELGAGEEFNAQIRRAVLRSNVFVFLASRDALRAGAYTLTELGIAERRWPHPAGRVLPVVVDGSGVAELPPYLRAVSVLVPQGDVVAEVVDAVARLRRAWWRRVGLWAGAGVVAVALAAAVVLWPGSGGDGPTDGPDADPHGPEGSMNSHVYTLKNGSHVRLVGSIVENRSNVADRIVRREVEYNAWRYNRCYDASFGQLKESMPQGSVTIAFEIDDQLPRRARVERSDFTAVPAFDRCVLGTLVAQTMNSAGAEGRGAVRYAFRFVPN